MRTDRASRLIRAPLAKVYAAFVEPEALVRWLPPEGMSGEILEFDARPGGRYRMALTYRDPNVAGKTDEHGDVIEARFLALVPGKKIIQAAEFESEDPAFAGTMAITWTFEEGGEAPGDATRVAIVCDNVPAGIRKQDHLAGLKSSLANLATFVE